MATASTAVELEPSTATRSLTEVASALKALGDADKTALMKIARIYAARTCYGAEDLLQEAMCRLLSGARIWPRHVALIALLAGVMRSLAWEWRQQAATEAADATDLKSGEAHAIATIDIGRIIALFDDDAIAQKIVIAMLQGARGQELQELSNLGKTEYESKRTKIRRRIEKLML
jgi:DNA-directed RNA polymerase specialized sigma24 family protein